MALDRKILRIVDTISAISNKQIAVEAIVDPDLAYKMWGGKDADGNTTKWLSKDKPIQVTTATLTGGTTTGSDGLVRHDTNGLLSGGAILLADLNALISDATLFGEEDFDANTILKADSDDTPIALTVPEQTLVGRKTGGVIDALTVTEIKTLLALTLDDAYEASDPFLSIITMDIGDIEWHTSGPRSFVVELAATTGTADGFHVLNGADLFKLNYESADNISLTALLKSFDVTTEGGEINFGMVGAYSLNVDLAACTGTADGFQVLNGSDYLKLLFQATDTLSFDGRFDTIAFRSANNVIIDAGGSADMTLSARAGSINLNQSGADIELVGHTATSIVGALNENKLKRTQTTVSAATYSTLATDSLIKITRTSTGAHTLTITSLEISKVGRRFKIKDAGLNASINNITINTQGSETIEGQTSLILNGDGDSVELQSDGSNLQII
jgi:hypothetical protein